MKLKINHPLSLWISWFNKAQLIIGKALTHTGQVNRNRIRERED